MKSENNLQPKEILVLAHQKSAKCAGQLAFMLERSRLSPTKIIQLTAELRAAADALENLTKGK